MPRLTPEDRDAIRAKYDADVPVKEIAKQYSVTAVTIYSVLSKPRAVESTAASMLEREIAQAESRIVELQKTLAEVDRLKQEIKVKKSVLEALKALPSKQEDHES